MADPPYHLLLEAECAINKKIMADPPYHLLLEADAPLKKNDTADLPYHLLLKAEPHGGYLCPPYHLCSWRIHHEQKMIQQVSLDHFFRVEEKMIRRIVNLPPYHLFDTAGPQHAPYHLFLKAHKVSALPSFCTHGGTRPTIFSSRRNTGFLKG